MQKLVKNRFHLEHGHVSNLLIVKRLPILTYNQGSCVRVTSVAQKPPKTQVLGGFRNVISAYTFFDIECLNYFIESISPSMLT